MNWHLLAITASKRFARVVSLLGLMLVCLLGGVAAPAAAQTISQKYNGADRPIVLEYWNTSDGQFTWSSPRERRSTADWTADQMAAVERGMDYWWEVLGAENTPGRTITLRLLRNGQEYTPGKGWEDSSTHAAPAELVVSGNNRTSVNNVWAYGNTAASPEVVDAIVNFDKTEMGFSRNGPVQLVSEVNIETTMIHELAHTLGMISGTSSWGSGTSYLDLYESMVITLENNGTRKPVVLGDPITPELKVYFNGQHARSVFGDSDFGTDGYAVPITWTSDQKSHLGIDSFTMTHEEFRNYPYFNEVELAILQDLGFKIDRRKFFGRSIYTDGEEGSATIENQAGFNSTSTYGVGLHVKASDRKVIQKADLISAGVAGTGIRVDGNKNHVIIDEGVNVQADGEYGMGLIVSNGKHNEITHRGKITAKATGDGAGTGIYLGFGYNTVDVNKGARNSASEGKYSGGYLVNSLDITGSIDAGGNAIWIDHTAAVEKINLMAGTELKGDIVSDALKGGDYKFERPMITFGYKASDEGQATKDADEDFHMTYDGDIRGATLMEARFVGGRGHETGVSLNGSNSFQTVEVLGTSMLTLAGSLTSAEGIEVAGVINSIGGTITAAEDIRVLKAGRLAGTGVIEARLVKNESGGSMFAGNSIGTLKIIGQFESDGALEFDLTHQQLTQDASFFDVANGEVVINGDVAFSNRGAFEFRGADPTATESYEIGRRYQIVRTEAPGKLKVHHRPKAEDDITNRRLILRTDTDVSGFYSPDAQYYYAYVGRDVPFANLAVSGNQQSIGQYLDTVFQFDDGSPLANEVQWFRDSLDLMPNEADVLKVMSQMTGEMYASTASMMVQQSYLIQNRLASRLRGDQSRLGWCDGEIDEDGNPEKLGLGGWVEGFGTGGSTQGNSYASGYDYSAGGVQVVVNRWLSCESMLGAYYNNTEASLNGGSMGRVGAQTNEFGALFTHRAEMSYALFMAGGGVVDLDSRRGFIVGNGTLQAPLAYSLRGKGKGQFANVYVEYGGRFSDDFMTLRPLVGLGYANYSQNALQETGSDFAALQVSATSADSLRTVVGAEINLLLNEARNLRWDGRALYMHDLLKHNSSAVTASLVGVPGQSFVVQGAGIGRDYAVIGATLSQNLWNDNVRAFAGYDLFASGQQTFNSGFGGIEASW